MTTRIPIVTFATGAGPSAVEIDAALFVAAEAALEKERERQARLAAEAQPTKPPPAPARRLVGLIGAKASGWF